MMSGTVVVVSSSHRGNPGLAPRSSQYKTRYIHSFTIFQFCFEYISSHSAVLSLLILSLAMGSNFYTLHPCQPQQRFILCTHQLSNSCQGNSFLQSCDIIQPSKHQISTPMYSTVSIAPQSMGSLTRISHPPPSNGLSPHFIIEPLISASLPTIPLLEPSK